MAYPPIPRYAAESLIQAPFGQQWRRSGPTHIPVRNGIFSHSICHTQPDTLNTYRQIPFTKMVLQSSAQDNLLLYLAGTALGIVLVLAAVDGGIQSSNEFAAVVLGGGIALISLGAMAIMETRRIEIDTEDRVIRLDIERNMGLSKSIVVPFDDITGVKLGRQGSRSGGSIFYDLVIIRRTERDLHLMGGCVFAGRMDRIRMNSFRHQIQEAIGRTEQESPRYPRN